MMRQIIVAWCNVCTCFPIFAYVLSMGTQIPIPGISYSVSDLYYDVKQLVSMDTTHGCFMLDIAHLIR